MSDLQPYDKKTEAFLIAVFKKMLAYIKKSTDRDEKVSNSFQITPQSLIF